MKRLLILILFLSLFNGLFSQTQQNLPTGSKAYSASLFITPDTSIWTGKSGSYTKLTTFKQLLSVIPDKIKPSQLNLSTQGLDLGVLKVPAVNIGPDVFNAGLYVSQRAQDGYPNSIVRRWGDRIKSAKGVDNDDVVTKYQLDSVVINSPGVQKDNIKDTILNSPRSLILSSENISIKNANYSSNIILGSMYSSINNFVTRTSIISSNNSTILGGRSNSSIIASEGGKLELYTGGGGLKWNSALIASKLSTIRGNASYALGTGKGVIVNSSAQFVAGQNNLDETPRSVDDPLKKNFIIGNGTGSDDTQPTVRSNAFHVTQGGKGWIQNEFEVGKSGGGLILKSPDGSRWLITVSNTGQLITTKQ